MENQTQDFTALSMNNSNTDIDLLKEAMEKFQESSSKLEAKYSQLLAEAERVKEQLRIKEQEVKQAQRLALLGETAAAIAHEIRNPLGAIRIFASLLKEDLAERPDSLSLVENIESSLLGIDRVITNILHFAKGHGDNLAVGNVHSLIHEEILAFVNQHPEVKINFQLDGNPFLMINSESFRQMLRNIFLNAFQAKPDGLELTLEVADSDSGKLHLMVRDNGPGIPEPIQANLFEPFVTTKKEGTGLGLAIVQQIVEQHSGKIGVSNDSGAVFDIYLPRNGKDTDDRKENLLTGATK